MTQTLQHHSMTQHSLRKLLNFQKPHDGNFYVPYVLADDEGFCLYPNVMRPFGGRTLSVHKRVFNYCLRKARKCVDSAFAIQSNKFKIFHQPLNVSWLSNQSNSCMLHASQFCQRERWFCIWEYADCHWQYQRGTMHVVDVRQICWVQYFMSGQCPGRWVEYKPIYYTHTYTLSYDTRTLSHTVFLQWCVCVCELLVCLSALLHWSAHTDTHIHAQTYYIL